MTDAVLVDQSFERTLEAWQRAWGAGQGAGIEVQGWCFDGLAERRAAEKAWAAIGVRARIRCALKPLVHAFLEDLGLGPWQSVRVRLPHASHAPARRFALEAYPLAALVAPAALHFEVQPAATTQPADLAYEVELTHRDGRVSRHRIAAPNRYHRDATGRECVSPTGWLRVTRGAQVLVDERVATDYERLFETAMQSVSAHAWPAQAPYFGRLQIDVDLHGFTQPLARVAHERICTAEALHEELYFALLEFFEQHARARDPAATAQHSRRLQPGQIVPRIHAARGAHRLRVSVGPLPMLAQGTRDPASSGEGRGEGVTAGRVQDAARLGCAPGEVQLRHHLQAIAGTCGGVLRSVRSVQGRSVLGLERRAQGVPVLISGGQHANETSGIVGALRAAQALAAAPEASFACIPCENPDGHALMRELIAERPHDMHHAARYTALGDDLQWRVGQPSGVQSGARADNASAPLYERALRDELLARSGATLHVNLHGYPSHEWIRPLSGYVPQGFEDWTLPKGFMLIARHHPGLEDLARALVEAVCEELALLPGYLPFNAAQMALAAAHAGPLPFTVHRGTAWTSGPELSGAPVMLITEFPDETIEGDAFRFAHTVQMTAALAAWRAWQRLGA